MGTHAQKPNDAGAAHNPNRQSFADIDDSYLTTEQASDYLRERKKIDISAATLNMRRSFGKAPAYVKIGQLVRYRKNDLDMFALSVGLSTKGFEQPKREPPMTAGEKARRAGK
jgi:hypothetical protein